MYWSKFTSVCCILEGIIIWNSKIILKVARICCCSKHTGWTVHEIKQVNSGMNHGKTSSLEDLNLLKIQDFQSFVF